MDTNSTLSCIFNSLDYKAINCSSLIMHNDITLDYLNAEETRRRIGPIVYLSLLTLFGIPGNLLILFVYTMRFQRKATHRTFVVGLSTTDLLVCTFTMPFEIAQMTHEYTFYSSGLCKFGRTINAILTMSSAFILIALSGNRFRRICYPLRLQLTYYQALKCIGFVVGIAALLAIPETVFAGLEKRQLSNNITGSDCSHAETYIGTPYPTIYSVIMLIVYIMCMISLLITSSVIGRHIIKQMEFHKQFRVSNLFAASQKSTVSTTSLHNGRDVENDNEQERKKKRNSPERITRTALIVSVCFIILFVPFVVVRLMSAIGGGDFLTPNQAISITLPILARTHLMNSVMNCYIYLYMDKSFRNQCKTIFTAMFYRIVNFVFCHWDN